MCFCFLKVPLGSLQIVLGLVTLNSLLLNFMICTLPLWVVCTPLFCILNGTITISVVLWGCRSVASANTHSELLPGMLGDLWLWVNGFMLVCGNPAGLNWSFFHLQKNLHHLLPSNHEGPQESDHLCSPQEYQLYMRVQARQPSYYQPKHLCFKGNIASASLQGLPTFPCAYCSLFLPPCIYFFGWGTEAEYLVLRYLS